VARKKSLNLTEAEQRLMEVLWEKGLAADDRRVEERAAVRVYALVPAKGGSKLKPSGVVQSPSPGLSLGSSGELGICCGRFALNRVSMERLATLLSSQTDRPVLGTLPEHSRKGRCRQAVHPSTPRFRSSSDSGWSRATPHWNIW
jgi:hypothetical protein